MRNLPVSLQRLGALAFSCIMTFVIPAAASAPRQTAQTQQLGENVHSRRDLGHRKAGHHASASAKRTPIQARPRPESKKRRPARTAQIRPAKDHPCLHAQVEIVPPQGPPEHLALTQCDGRPAAGAVEAMGRWMGMSQTHVRAQETHRTAMLARLQAIATAFPGHAIRLKTPCAGDAGRAGHEHGQALDVEVDGTAQASQLALCRTLPDTACGQIGGSAFVHVEVRRSGSGHLFWFENVESTK